MILVVDDLRSPTNNSNVICVRNYEQAIVVLSQVEALDELWLDHDLGEGKTGYDIALWLEARAYAGNLLPIADITIHSQNPIGSQRIFDALSPHYQVRKAPASSYELAI